jgi:hypothetical protein
VFARGGSWVLRSGDEIYHLVHQEGLEAFAAQQVQISGTLDAKTKTIDNIGVQAEAVTKPSRH